MQSIIQISNRNAPRLAVANLGVETGSRKVEVGCSIEGKPALANVPRVLGGVVRDCHTLIVYAIRSCEKIYFDDFRRKSSTKKRGVCPAFFVAEMRLLPVAFYQDILAMTMDPVVGDPVLAMMRRLLVVAGRPDIMVAVVAMIAGLPNVSLSGRRTAPFIHWRGWSDANHDLRKRCGRHQSKSEQQCHCNFLHGNRVLQGWLLEGWVPVDCRTASGCCGNERYAAYTARPL